MRKVNLHTHTLLCDGKNTPEEMVLSAIEKNFDVLGFSGHSASCFDGSGCIPDSEISAYKAEIARLKEKYKNDPLKAKINEIIRRETRPFSNGLLILYPIGDAGKLTNIEGNHKPPFGFAAVFPDRKGKGNLKSYRMNDIALEKDSDELYG